ncbi:hypothetical protein Lfu02_17720 [Longispora fulva]|uniref:Uncharacterized protein n=1 Tax=Longispora fulva TaxID=619741 RepID=A0A8J7GGG8_9ACTN|nr:hypothetical protein [Longispora fulva]GIG57400.1 hypothetical protein Lfu02_17720 [Longispora fulva]
MPDEFSALFKGIENLERALDKQTARVDRATLAATKANQARVKRGVKQRLRGRPRWDHRGRSRPTPEPVDLHLSPPHVERSGGPGRFTGALFSGISSRSTPKRQGVDWVGAVWVRGGIRNFYKRKLEAKFPYFKPALDASLVVLRETWVKAWDRSMSRK